MEEHKALQKSSDTLSWQKKLQRLQQADDREAEYTLMTPGITLYVKSVVVDAPPKDT